MRKVVRYYRDATVIALAWGQMGFAVRIRGMARGGIVRYVVTAL